MRCERKIYEERYRGLSRLQQGWEEEENLHKQDPPVSKQCPPNNSGWMSSRRLGLGNALPRVGLSQTSSHWSPRLGEGWEDRKAGIGSIRFACF